MLKHSKAKLTENRMNETKGALPIIIVDGKREREKEKEGGKVRESSHGEIK